MAEFVRIFHSSVDPADVDEVRELFTEDVRPAFANSRGCLGVELLISIDKNAGGLVEGKAISRWSSREDMDKAMESREMREALVRILQLLRQEPVTRIFEVTA
jgi:quinol monooxygenase YgiN